MKMYEFRLGFYRIFFLSLELTIYQLCADNGLEPIRRQAITWTNDGQFTDANWRQSASMS